MLITRCEIEAVDCNNWRISLVHSTDDLYTAAAVSASSSDRVSDSQWLAGHIACNSAQLAANHCVIRPAELSLLPPTRQEMISTSYHRWVTGLLQLTGRTLVLYLYPLLITRGETTAPHRPSNAGGPKGQEGPLPPGKRNRSTRSYQLRSFNPYPSSKTRLC